MDSGWNQAGELSRVTAGLAEESEHGNRGEPVSPVSTFATTDAGECSRARYSMTSQVSSVSCLSGPPQAAWGGADRQSMASASQQRTHAWTTSQPCATGHQRWPDLPTPTQPDVANPPSIHTQTNNPPKVNSLHPRGHTPANRALFKNPTTLPSPNLVLPRATPPNQGFGTDDMAGPPPLNTPRGRDSFLGQDMPTRPRPIAAHTAPAVPGQASQTSTTSPWDANLSTASLPVPKTRTPDRGNRLQRRCKNASSGSQGSQIAPPGHLEPNNPYGYPAPPPFGEFPPQTERASAAC